MEIVIFFSILVVLAFMALGYGTDSRPSEHEHSPNL